MPKDTFIKLPEEKKNKIIEAAKKEFSRVSIQEASIKNIVEEAKIARGSFYQYFDSKEDLLKYILNSDVDTMNAVIINALKQSNGDIFKTFIKLYDFVVQKIWDKEDFEFHKKIFENMKTCEDTISYIKPKEPGDIFSKKEIYDLMDTSTLDVKDEEDIRILISMLNTITKKSLAINFRYKSRKEAKDNYLKQLEYLKYGVIRRKQC